MNERLKNGVIAGIFIAIFIAQFAICAEAMGNLSNELLAWGFTRGKNHEQAVLDTESKRVIDEFNGISIESKDTPNVYLTFDCGYEAGYTGEILDTLKEKNVKAIFFITGHYLNTASDLVKRMIEEGHIVGNHTVNHKCLPNISDEEVKNEIMKLHNALYEKFGYEMKYFRPPKGEFSERVISIANDLGYRTVMWSSAYDDWDREKQGREEYGKKKILDNLHNGCVLLLHATSVDNKNILGNVIDEARNMGYEFCSF